MVIASLVIASLLLTSLLIWLAYRYLRNARIARDTLSGPARQMQDELLRTADSVIDRMDAKMAQIEILLEELDRRGRLVSQQIERQQALQSQMEIQRKQLGDWVTQQHQLLEREFEGKKNLLEGFVQTMPAKLPANAAPTSETRLPETPLQKKAISTSRKKDPLAPFDKRAMILKLAEEGLNETEIAQRIGVGKGEVTLLLKLRKKV